MKYKIVKISWWFGFAGFTVYPYIFQVDDSLDIKHEEVHIEQQYSWYKNGWYFGILAWLFCYLALLPIGWNKFRWDWEKEAYIVGSGLRPSVTVIILQTRYFLWWHV